LDISVQALPIVELAWLNGPTDPIPEFILICSRMGPFTTTILAAEDVELRSEVAPVDAMARITGKYSGLAPAITALTATISTLYSQPS
jgi:hypothetical protein